MDDKTIKTLLVDDEPELREVLSDILTAKGFEPVPAETGAAALARIEQQDIDVALIDIKLEDMSGLEVLSGIKARSPQVECILLTGYASQATAIEAINLGAYAYFQKPYDVEQLLVAIRRAAEKHAVGHAMQESEARFRSMIENSSDLICILNPDATLRYISPSIERLLGYTKEDIVIGTGLRHYIHPDDITAFVDAFRQHIQASDPSPVPMQLRVRHKNGTWRMMEGTGSNLLEDPAIEGIVINARDITEREHAEEALIKQSQDIALINRLNQAFNQGVTLTDYVSTLSEDFTRLFGSNPSHLYLLDGEKQFLVLQGSFSSEKIIKRIERLIGISVPFIDIPVGTISLYSRALQEKKVLLCNDPQAVREMMAEYAQVFLPKQLLSRVKKSIPNILEILGHKGLIIMPLLAGDEPMGILEVPSKAPFSDEDLGRIEIIAGQLTAAILRKRAEDALWQTTGLLESIFAGLHTMVAYLDADFNFIRVNLAYAAADNQSPEYFIGKNHFDLYPDPENEAVFKEVVRSGKPYTAYAKPFEYAEHPERGVSYWDWTISPIKDEKGKVSNIILSVVNVTERKRAEDAERQAEIRYRSLFEQTHDAIFILDLEGRHLDANPRAAEMLGYTREEILKLSFKDVSAQLPESQQVLERLLAGEQVPLYERIFRKKNGDLIPVEINAELVRDAVGQPLHIQSVVRDITERKRAEERLAKLNACFLRFGSDPIANINLLVAFTGEMFGATCALYNQLQGNMLCSLGAWNTPSDYRFSDRSEGHICTDVIKSDKDEIVVIRNLQDSPYALTDPNVRQYQLQTYIGKPVKFEKSNVGSLCVVFQNDVIPSEDDQRMLGIIASAMGVEEDRKHAGEVLRESEERYRMLAENMSDTVWLMDMSLRTTYISPSVTRLRGFTLDEINSIPLDRQMPPDSFQRAFQLFAETLSPENLAQADQPVSRTIELEFYKKDGTKFWSENTFTLIRDSQGQPIAILGSGRDTSERRQAEEEIRHRAEELTALYESSQALAGKISLDDVLQTITKSALRLFDATGVGLYLYDPATRMLEIKLATHPTIPIGMRLSLGEGLAGKVAQTRRAMRIDDYAAWEGRSPQYEGIPVRATLETPLIYQDELVGVLVLHEAGDSERKFTEADERLISLFAAQAAAAIQNARLFEQTRRQVADLEVLYENGLSISVLLEPRKIAQKMIEILSQKLDWHHATIRLYHPETKRMELLALNKPGLNPDETQVEIDRLNKMTALPNKGLSGWVIKHGKTIRSGDVLADKRYLSTFPEIRSGLYVPLMIGERAIGSIAVESREANRFSAEDERLLKTLAAQSAIAFENAHLYQEAVSAAKRKAALHRGGLEIVRAGQDIEALCIALHHAAQQVMPAEAFTVSLLTKEGREVEAPYLFDRGMRHPNTRLPAGAGVTGRVIKSKKPLRIKDVQKTRGAKPIMVDGSEPTRSVLSVPLLAQDKIIGVLSAQSREPDAYSVEDQIFMETLASEAAVAFENARLFEETRRRVEELGVLARVSSTMRAASTPAEMYPIIVDMIMELFHADGATLSLHDSLTGENVVMAGGGPYANYIGFRIPPGKGGTGIVITNGKPYLTQDSRTDENIYNPDMSPDMGAMAFVPLATREGIIGVLSAGRAGTISENDVSLLTAVADIAANAIRRATLHEQTVQYAEQLGHINAMGRILAETLDTSAVYHRLTGAIYQLLPDTCAVFISLYNESSAQIVCACAHSDGAFIDHETLPPIPVTRDGKGRQSQVILTGKPFIANDLANNIPTTPRTLVSDQNKPARSGLYVPMIAQGKVIGILQAQSYADKCFGEPEQELLSLVANTAAVAIENARLFAETQQRLHRLSALHSIDAAIGASVDTHVTLSIVLERVITELKADAAAVLLFNPLTRMLEYAAGRGFRAHLVEGLRLRLGEGLAGQSALQRRSIHIADLQKADEVAQVLEHPVSGSAPAALQYLEGENFVAYYAIPLIAKGQVQGVFEIFRRTPMPVDQEWIAFFEMLAGQTAIAIDNGRLFENLQHSNLELTLAYDATIQGWSQALELRDEETEGHTQRVADLTLRLIQAVGVDDVETEHARRGALLHDIGKIAIPDSILLKPGPLDEREWSVMRQHPQYAYDLLSPVTYLRPALHIPWCHHEKWDGSGYPRGLKGEEIPMVARIFAIVDVYDALTSNRPYRLAWTRENALDYIREQSGTHFDPKVTKAFMELMRGEQEAVGRRQ